MMEVAEEAVHFMAADKQRVEEEGTGDLFSFLREGPQRSKTSHCTLTSYPLIESSWELSL